MKRSFINKKIKEGIEFMNSMQYTAAPFCYWTAEDWRTKGAEYDEIRDCMLGWDITDFGEGDFYKVGLLLITLRNGIANSKEYNKEYAEKCLIVEDGQVTPMHYHTLKMEDIINRGGGELIMKVYNATEDNKLADTPVTAYMDGKRFTVEAGAELVIKPGESITLPPRQYHSFWARGGKTLLTEVSKVNNDKTDNNFLSAPSRFPAIEEDEEKEYLLFSEYPK